MDDDDGGVVSFGGSPDPEDDDAVFLANELHSKLLFKASSVPVLYPSPFLSYLY